MRYLIISTLFLSCYFNAYTQQETEFYYDNQNRLTQVIYLDGLSNTVVNYAYDELGNRLQYIVSSSASQTLSIKKGWSGVSSYVSLVEKDVEQLFNPILSDLIILQNSSGMFWPGQNVNTLGTWNTHEGYQIKVANDVELTISGTRENNKSLQLAEGWNLIPVLSECDANIADLFSGNYVTIIKEVAGTGIYWPEFGINTLQVFKPGKAYFVLLDNEAEITYPECNDLKSVSVRTLTGFKTLSELSPWQITKPTASSHTIAIPARANIQNQLYTGDFIGAFDATGNCCGATIWQNQNTTITLFGDDPITEQKDGFLDGDVISFKVQKLENSFALKVEFDQSQPHYDGNFHTNGLSAIKTVELSGTDTEDFTQSSFEVYPNPADEILHISKEFTGKAELSIINMQGIKVYSAEFEGMETEIDIKGLPAGVYFVQIKGDQLSGVRRVVIQ